METLTSSGVPKIASAGVSVGAVVFSDSVVGGRLPVDRLIAQQ